MGLKYFLNWIVVFSWLDFRALSVVSLCQSSLYIYTKSTASPWVQALACPVTCFRLSQLCLFLSLLVDGPVDMFVDHR